MDTLNQDMLIEILSHLPQKDKIQSSRVCKSWNNINKYTFKNFNINYHEFKHPSFKKWNKEKHVKLDIDCTRSTDVEFDKDDVGALKD